jgi:uncharacterized protein YkwD/putative cell wall-binding protein
MKTKTNGASVFRKISSTLLLSALTMGLLVAVPAPAYAESLTLDGYTLAQARQIILTETNAARTAKGLKPLAIKTELNTVAQNWTFFMADNNKYFHNYNYTAQYPSGWQWAGENIAMGQKVTEVVDAWIASPGHYANMMNPTANFIGIGVSSVEGGQNFFTQNLAYYPVAAPTPTATPKPTATATPKPTATATPKPTATAIPTATPKPTATATPTATPKPTATATPTATPKPTATPAPTVAPVAKPVVTRIPGGDRYATSVAISQKFPRAIPVLYIVNENNHFDMASAAPAAAKQAGGMLITTQKAIPSSILAEIKRLAPKKIVVVGDTNSVSASVYTTLSKLTPSIRRDAGKDRYATSITVNTKVFPAGKTPEAYIVSGTDPAANLSGVAAAAAKKIPVFVVPSTSTKSALPAATKTALQKLGVKKVTILGDTVKISSLIESNLRSTFGTANVKRITGTNILNTSYNTNRAAFTTAKEVFLVNSNSTANALSSATLAGARNAPLYLVSTSCVPNSVLTEITRLKATRVTIVGNTQSLNDRVAKLTKC